MLQYGCSCILSLNELPALSLDGVGGQHHQQAPGHNGWLSTEGGFASHSDGGFGCYSDDDDVGCS